MTTGLLLLLVGGCSDYSFTDILDGFGRGDDPGTTDSETPDSGLADSGPTDSEPPGCADADLDGHTDQTCGGDDCDDCDDTVHPDAEAADGSQAQSYATVQPALDAVAGDTENCVAPGDYRAIVMGNRVDFGVTDVGVDSSGATPTVSWTARDGDGDTAHSQAGFQVQVATASWVREPTALLDSGEQAGSDTSFTLATDPGGTWFVRVRVMDGEGAWSA